MIFKPIKLSLSALPDDQLRYDRKNCARYGPCGVGEKALYMGGLWLDRKYYVPFSSAERIYKRVAMSKGGFTGKGIFASIPYLVVEYDGGRQFKSAFKREEQVDSLLRRIAEEHPDIKRHSAEAEKKLADKERHREKKLKRTIPDDIRQEIDFLERCALYLEKQPSLFRNLSAAARRKRAYDNSSPAYRWVAMFITLMGAAAAAYGIYSIITGGVGGFSLYFLLFGLAAIFFFSGMSVLPTARNNKRRIQQSLERAEDDMEKYIEDFHGFPLPARYAHPAVLRRIEDILADGRAAAASDALDVLKDDLKALNRDVQVEQEEYDEIIAIKPMFLINSYK